MWQNQMRNLKYTGKLHSHWLIWLSVWLPLHCRHLSLLLLCSHIPEPIQLTQWYLYRSWIHKSEPSQIRQILLFSLCGHCNFFLYFLLNSLHLLHCLLYSPFLLVSKRFNGRFILQWLHNLLLSIELNYYYYSFGIIYLHTHICFRLNKWPLII